MNNFKYKFISIFFIRFIVFDNSKNEDIINIIILFGFISSFIKFSIIENIIITPSIMYKLLIDFIIEFLIVFINVSFLFMLLCLVYVIFSFFKYKAIIILFNIQFK